MPWVPIHPIYEGKKVCISCKEIILISNFAKQKKCKDGIRPQCKTCLNKKNKIYYSKNKDKVLERSKSYNKTEFRKAYCRNFAKIKLKIKRESNASRPRTLRCECCGDLPDCKGIVWDHDHESGLFRGWLCNRCNRVLGMCKDNKLVFENLTEYLEKHGKRI